MKTIHYLFCLLFGLSYQLAVAQSEADVLLDTAVALVKTNEEDSAAYYFRQALSIYQDCDSLANWIEAHKAYGKAFRKREKDVLPKKTVAVLLQATQDKLWREPANQKEWDALIWLYVNTAYTYYYKLEDYEKAAAVYESANRLHTRYIGDPDRLVINYIYKPLANLYTRLGDGAAAEVYLNKCINFSLERGLVDEAAKATSDLSMAQMMAGRTEQAKSTLEEGIRLKGLSPKARLLLWGNLAKMQHDSGEILAAEKSLEQSFNLLQQLLLEEQHLTYLKWLAGLHILKGDIYLSKDQLEPAETELLKAENILIEHLGHDGNRDLADLYAILGKIYQRQKDFSKAITAFHKMLAVMLDDFSPHSWKSQPNPEGFTAEYMLIDALFGKAETLKAWYDEAEDPQMLEIALHCHELIFAVEQLQRRTYRYESSKLFNVADARRRSTQAISLALLLYQNTGKAGYKETALAFAERSKSTLMLEAFYNSRAVSLAGLPDSTLQKETELQQAISDIEEALYAARSKSPQSDRIQQLEMDLLNLKQKYTDWIEELEVQYPRYYKLKYNFNTRTASDIQRFLLSQGQAFIEYFVGDEVLYAFLITKEEFEIISIPKDFPLEDWIVELRESIEGFQFSSSDRSSLCEVYSRLAFQLYNHLLLPLEEHGLPDELIIVPDGVLGFLPFDALLTSAPVNTCDFDNYPYLLQRYNMQYAYSATLQHVLEERPLASRKLVGFAPAFDGNNGFGILNHNISLLNTIQDYINGKVFIKEAATIDNLHSNASNSGLLHFATHAQANTDAEDFSFIVLSDGVGGYDSLFVKDIYLLPLQAEMTVLSACETSVGKLYQGEGIINLARSFLYAGSNSMITTQWSINDAANRELMEAFYLLLKKGKSKSEALRLAKLQQIEKGGRLHAHPVYWAAFAPIGNMRPVYSQRSKYWVLGIGISLGLILVGRRYYSSKKI